MRCPCRKKSETRSYAECCEPFHAGTAAAPTAEALMRSRYAAFALGLADYLRATWHPATRPASLSLTTGEEWLLLRILEAKTDGDTAKVEFIARSRIDSRTHVLHETSRFVRENGKWFYADGVLQD